MNQYSSIVFRDFKRFVGELTATAAGIQIATSCAARAAAALDVKDPWKSLGTEEGIRVHGLDSSRVRINTARLNIVSLYSGFDLFLSNLRDQHFKAHGSEWKQHKGDTPLTEITRNNPTPTSIVATEEGKYLWVTLDYYRLVRNAVAHPSDENTDRVNKYFVDNSENLEKTRISYGMQSAPNSYETLSFHDVKIFAQVTLKLCKAIDKEFDPGDNRLKQQIPVSFRGSPKSKERTLHAVKGWLKTTYGISDSRADTIARSYMTHQLDG